ncbi:3'-5' exonuclease [Polynucleobacter paneuropaeus]|nr:3'-5' exonuclease [Polynucleobacter paneuropaeus]
MTLKVIATASLRRKSKAMESDSFYIIDFETTGLSPTNGDRVIEVAALKIVSNKIVDQYQSLMNPGFEISKRITNITGISNDMLDDAPSNSKAIGSLVEFLEDNALVAHNASFDSNFLKNELLKTKIKRSYQFTCSMRMARRIFPKAPNHKLGTLLQYRGISHSDLLHRALADVNATYKLWIDMNKTLAAKSGKREISFLEMRDYI